MLSTEEQRQLHEEYGQTIAKVSEQVFHQFRRKGGKLGHGYPVVEPDDLTQSVFLKLVETDMGVDALEDLDEAQAWIRTTARQVALSEAEKRRRAVQADYSGGDEATWSWVTEDPAYASDEGLPHEVPDEMAWADTKRRVEETVESILRRIHNPEHQALFRLYYVDGLDQKDAAKALQRSMGWVYKYMSVTRKELGAEAARSLEVYRHWSFPDLYKFREDETEPTELVEALGAHS